MHDARPRTTFRSQLRWTNGIGFALTLFFALWTIAFLLVTLKHGLKADALPLPPLFAFVGVVSLLATIVLLGVFFVRFMWHGHDVSSGRARATLFAWTCCGAVFFLSQGLALMRFGAEKFPRLPGWLSELYWYLAAVGVFVFSLLLWVNSEHHGHGWHFDEDEDHDDAYEDDDHDGYDDED